MAGPQFTIDPVVMAAMVRASLGRLCDGRWCSARWDGGRLVTRNVTTGAISESAIDSGCSRPATHVSPTAPDVLACTGHAKSLGATVALPCAVLVDRAERWADTLEREAKEKL